MENELEHSNDIYVIIPKTTSDIIKEIDFKNEDDELICSSIIHHLEKQVSETLRDDKCANIPFIGCIRRNPIKVAIKNKTNSFRQARKYLNKEEYKEKVRGVVNNIKEKIRIEEKNKVHINKVRQRNKKKYEVYYTKLGRAYAEMFIASILLLREVPFDIEFQNYYDSLK